MKKSRKELEKECAEAEAKVEQYQHRGQRYENRIRYYAEGERKRQLSCKRFASPNLIPFRGNLRENFWGKDCDFSQI